MRGQNILAGLLLTLIASSAASAQSTAQINGTIKDSSGAVLPGVEVTVNQTDTGLRRSTVTDETGFTYCRICRLGPIAWRQSCRASEVTFRLE